MRAISPFRSLAVTGFSFFLIVTLGGCYQGSGDASSDSANAATNVGLNQTVGPIPSPDGIWTIVDEVNLPPGYSPPTEYVAATLDWPALQALLDTAPPEMPGTTTGVRMTLPMPEGDFEYFSIASTLMMERTLANAFPQLRTFRFDSVAGDTVGGHIVTGMMKFNATGQSVDGLLRIEPVMTSEGTLYIVFYDRNRTDGLNEFEHVLDEQMDPTIPPPALRNSALDALQVLALSRQVLPQLPKALATTGDTLRTFRFTATTTGEFYQANDTGNGDVDVIQSLIVRLNAVNAVFEREVGVRLLLAANTMSVLFNDPNTDGINDGDTPCNLREANKTIAQNNLAEADYDLGFLFSTGGSGGCAWYVVCEDSINGFPAHDKARGAGHFGANGMGQGTGLILHETGHQLGAKHTYSGQASGCNLANFDGDDNDGLPSAFEPGSGTTIMSYFSGCGSDNVEVTNDRPAGQYYHAKSFEQIVDNITSGNGSLCGGALNTGNTAPTVDAGADYTIPTQTPFTLSGSGNDIQPLTFTWEQIDLATTQRPIDTDDGIGPIIRSLRPGTSPDRTIPDIRDLLANVSRAGELLPQVNRNVNFRLTARDDQPAGGGVNSDDMVVTAQGSPFFITAPNSGSLQAGCTVPVTWEVGGGNVANNVDVLYSTTGGLAGNGVDQSFPEVIAASTPNDGEYLMTVPCGNTTGGRIKVMASDNIFFDVNDNDLNVVNDPPQAVVDPIADGEVDDQCEFTVEFTAMVTDSCGVSAADVSVSLNKGPPGDYTLGIPAINVMQNGTMQVDVSGSVLVSDLMSSPASLEVRVDAMDNCGAIDNDSVLVSIADTIPPEIDVSVDPDTLWPPNHTMQTIQATVTATDNCPGVSYELAGIVSDEPDNGTGDGDTVDDIQNADVGTPDLVFDLRSERAGNQDGRIYTITYSASDGGDNSTDADAYVTVPKSQKK